jgi:hypothetical protein
MNVHVVRAGEYLTQLASRFGCAPSDIWDHPSNGIRTA